MSTPNLLDGRSVLLHSPQSGVAERIHMLLDAGARVTVRSSHPDATLRDLASRRLIALVEDADPLGFDVVLRDAARGGGHSRPAASRHAPRLAARDGSTTVKEDGSGEGGAAPGAAGDGPGAAGDGPGADGSGSGVGGGGLGQTWDGASTGVGGDISAGSVTLVGGGPGDLGLLTIAGMEAIRDADVLVCDRLAPLGALSEARPGAEVIHVGKIPRGEFTPQEAINDTLIEHAKAGSHVVRLKGGDSFVFGRGGEEWNACVAAGVPVRVIPGVSSSIAAAALAGVPVTHRSITQGFIVVSGHVGPDDHRNAVDWSALARSGLTIVVLMGVAALRQVADRLIADGLPPSTPAACVADASMPSQRSVTGTLADIDRLARDAGIGAPAVTIIGDVVTALEQP